MLSCPADFLYVSSLMTWQTKIILAAFALFFLHSYRCSVSQTVLLCTSKTIVYKGQIVPPVSCRQWGAQVLHRMSFGQQTGGKEWERTVKTAKLSVSKAIKHSFSAILVNWGCLFRSHWEAIILVSTMLLMWGKMQPFMLLWGKRSFAWCSLAAVEQEIYWVARQSCMAWTINLMWKGDLKLTYFLMKPLHASWSVVTVKVWVSICTWEIPDRDESLPGIPCALKHGKERTRVRRIAKMMPWSQSWRRMVCCSLREKCSIYFFPPILQTLHSQMLLLRTLQG